MAIYRNNRWWRRSFARVAKGRLATGRARVQFGSLADGDAALATDGRALALQTPHSRRGRRILRGYRVTDSGHGAEEFVRFAFLDQVRVVGSQVRGRAQFTVLHRVAAVTPQLLALRLCTGSSSQRMCRLCLI